MRRRRRPSELFVRGEEAQRFLADVCATEPDWLLRFGSSRLSWTRRNAAAGNSQGERGTQGASRACRKLRPRGPMDPPFHVLCPSGPAPLTVGSSPFLPERAVTHVTKS